MKDEEIIWNVFLEREKKSQATTPLHTISLLPCVEDYSQIMGIFRDMESNGKIIQKGRNLGESTAFVIPEKRPSWQTEKPTRFTPEKGGE